MTTLPLTDTYRRSRTSAVTAVASQPVVWLFLMVVTSSAARVASGWRHTSPRLFPDEYIYATLARSLARGDGLTIRGSSAHFPALLEPILAAPFWLGGDATAAFRLTQGMHALAMSLAAVPVYWLTRRLGAPAWQALACGVFTVALPSFVYASYITADAVAFPLALGAIAVGVAVLDAPTRRNQVAFVGLAFLATFARIQYAIIPVAFVVAAIVLSGGRLPAAVRRYSVVAILFLVPALASVALGPRRLLGYYDGVLGLDISPLTLVHWIGVDAMLFAFAAGAAVVPGAVAGLVTGFRRSASKEHQAFAALTTAFMALLLLEAALYATNGSHRFQERYLIAIAPLLPVALCAGARALPAGRWVVVAVAATLALLAMAIPLSGYAALDGKQDSPFLLAFDWLQTSIGIGNAGLFVALATALLLCLAVLAAFRPGVGVGAVLAGAILAVGVSSVGGVAADRASAARMERTFSQNRAWTWADDTGVGMGSVLATPGTDRRAVGVDLFWNRNLTRLLRMPQAPEVDAFGDELTTIADDGLLLADGAPVRGPLLVEESFAKLVLDDARVVRRTVSATLWQPQGDARVAMMTVGRYIDNWAAPGTRITVWPREASARMGDVQLRLSLPQKLPRAVVRITAPGFTRRVTVAPGAEVTVTVPVRAVSRPVHVGLRGETAMLMGDRTVVVRLEPPKLLERGR